MGENFEPYIKTQDRIKEFSAKSIILGMVLGLVFGVGNAYLGLKVGSTVSASVPAAVLSMTILHLFFKRVTILENNMVQTIASVGEAIAAGVIFTAPALYILGAGPSLYKIILLSSLGAILGILFMIPMRRYIIVEEHGKLPFPEGSACAEIIKTKEKGKSQAFLALFGIAVGSIYKLLVSVFNLWKETPSWFSKRLNNFEFSIDCTPALLGVGYIIGPRIASYMFFGGALSWWVIIPLISMFSTGDVIVAPATFPVSKMSPEEIWSNYIRFVGAGAVAVGGLLSMVKIFPMIKKTLISGFKELFHHKKHRADISRTDKDISLRWLILGSVCIIAFIWLFPGFHLNFLTILLLTILGFFFVGVTSITVGIVGSTSNPASGMTITTLLLTCLIFLSIGWTERIYLISALTMSIVVNVAIALASTTSQDLKTGYLLGATPKWQQIGEIIGVILPAVAIGFTVYLLNQAYGFGSKTLPAPQASLMALIAKGVIAKSIPFTLVTIGVVIGAILAIIGLPVLPIAIGLYLPLSLSTGIFVGGIVHFLIKKFSEKEDECDRGILFSSGLVAGDACTGVVIASIIVFAKQSFKATSTSPQYLSLVMYLFLALVLAIACKGIVKSKFKK